MSFALGIAVDDDNAPLVDPLTLASTSRPGVHLVGCARCGNDTGSLFIENGRDDADVVAGVIAAGVG